MPRATSKPCKEEPNTVIVSIEKDREFELLSQFHPTGGNPVLHSFSALPSSNLLLSVQIVYA